MHYVRHRGVVSGPFDAATLLVQVRRGALSRVHQISRGDGTWIAAERITELFGGPVKLGSGVAPPRRSDEAASDDMAPAGFIDPTTEPVLDLSDAAPDPGFATRRGQRKTPWAVMAFAVIACLAVIGLTALIAYYTTRPEPSAIVPAPAPPAAQAASVPRAPVTGASTVPSVDSKITLPTAVTPVEPKPPDVPPPLPSAQTAERRSSTAAARAVAPVGEEAAFVRGIEEEAKIARATGLVVCGAALSRRGGAVSEVPTAEGSCFAVTADGYLLTNRHVIAEAQKLGDDRAARRAGVEVRPKVWVFFGGIKYEAQVVYTSAAADVAVLKVTREQPWFRLSVGGKTPRNEDVYAIGFPGLAMQPVSEEEFARQAQDESRRSADVSEYFKPRDFEFTLTRGVLGRTYSAEGGLTWIQHEATLRHGNSGGPLVNRAGIVLGINTRLQTSKQDVQTNLSLEISQLKAELMARVPGLVWE